MKDTEPSFETSLGAICNRNADGWRLELAELPLIHGLSVLSRALAEMMHERLRGQDVELSFERRLRPRENPELLAEFGVGHVRVQVGERIGAALTADPAALESRLRTILGTLQRQRYRELLFAVPRARRALVFDFELGPRAGHCRAILEWQDGGDPRGHGRLRLAFERIGHRNVDLATLPHEFVRDVERRHFLAGSTRIAHTWRDGLRREAERGHRSFLERRSVHGHLFAQLERAGLGHIERVEISWGDAQVAVLLEGHSEILDRDLKRVLLALEDDGVRSILREGEALCVCGTALEIWLDLAQRSRVLHLSLGGVRERAEVEQFLRRMPSLARLVDERRDAQPLAGVEIVLIHHITAEVLGVIGALRALGCRQLWTLFVAYAGEAPGSYLGPLLELPEDECSAFALSKVPDAARAEDRYRLSRQYSPLADMDQVEACVGAEHDFFGAMGQVARELFVRAALRAEQHGRRILILEDGGYLAPALHRALAEDRRAREFCATDHPGAERTLRQLLGDRLLGSVEHTRNGHDRLARVQTDGALSFPSYSIAISTLKRGVEAREVAVSVLQAIESILHACGRILSRRHALVLGSRGAIGSWLVRLLTERLERGTEQLAGLDLVAAPGGPFPEAPEFGALPREAWLRCDLLLGVTGTSVLRGAALEDWLLNAAPAELWIASGSTKTVEFADFAEWLRALRAQPAPRLGRHRVQLHSREILDPITGRHFGHRHRFEIENPDGTTRVRELCFLAHLMPINFLYYGVPTELIEEVLRALVQAGLGLVQGGTRRIGLHAVDHDIDADGQEFGRAPE